MYKKSIMRVAISLHLNNVVKDLRAEWVIFKHTETLERRNNRLLRELQLELEMLK